MGENTPTVFEYGYLCSYKDGSDKDASDKDASDKDASNKDGSDKNDWQYTFIPASDFAYLEKRCLTEGNGDFNQLMKPRIKAGSKLLQVQNFAGVIFVPSGLHIEVLPKTGRGSEPNETAFADARKKLLVMLQALGEFRHIQIESAGLSTWNMPLLEIFIGRFLESVNHVVKRGLRCDYVGQEDNVLVKKGKLNMAGQLRKNALHKHRFYCEFDEYIINRPINRILKTAMLKVQGYTRHHRHQKWLRELLFFFDGAPKSTEIKQDLARVRVDRGTVHYQSAFAWAKLILADVSPIGMKGEADAPSLLFPMEVVFEAYVAKILRSQIKEGFSVRAQSCAKTLVVHHIANEKRGMFTLKPDLIIEKSGEALCVLDTKWKRIDSSSKFKFKFDLSQADFYQMFAYGQKYLNGKGTLILIYPQTEYFTTPIEGHFKFSDDLKLWVLPFKIGNKGKSQLIFPTKSALSFDIGLPPSFSSE